ncbi:MAG: DUF177 domain-containing protein [Synergistaceae bacterium]|nr:DUF177 domain-containing protein [Synergistaceae bacterium]
MKALKSRPQEWSIRLILPSVPHDGTSYTDDFALDLASAVLYYGQEYRLTRPLSVHVEAVRSAERIILSISLEAEIETACARCLEPAKTQTSSTLHWIFSTTREDEEQRDEWKYDEVVLLDSWEEHIELGDYVWETFVTTLPVSVLCKADCRGLCPNCGANLNKQTCNCHDAQGDPRFAVLKNLL